MRVIHGVARHSAEILTFELRAEIFRSIQHGSVLVIKSPAHVSSESFGSAFESDGAPFSAHSELHTADEVRDAFVVQDADVRFRHVGIVDFYGVEGPGFLVAFVDRDIVHFGVLAEHRLTVNFDNAEKSADFRDRVVDDGRRADVGLGGVECTPDRRARLLTARRADHELHFVVDVVRHVFFRPE